MSTQEPTGDSSYSNATTPPTVHPSRATADTPAGSELGSGARTNAGRNHSRPSAAGKRGEDSQGKSLPCDSQRWALAAHTKAPREVGVDAVLFHAERAARRPLGRHTEQRLSEVFAKLQVRMLYVGRLPNGTRPEG